MTDRSGGEKGDTMIRLLVQLRGMVEEAEVRRKELSAPQTVLGYSSIVGQGPSGSSSILTLSSTASAAISRAGLRKIREDVFKLELLQRENRDTTGLLSEATESSHQSDALVAQLRRQIDIMSTAFGEREKDLLSTIERLRKAETCYRMLQSDLDNTRDVCALVSGQTVGLRADLKAQRDELDRVKVSLRVEHEATKLAENMLEKAFGRSSALHTKVREREEFLLSSQSEQRLLESKLTRSKQICSTFEQQCKDYRDEIGLEREAKVKSLNLVWAAETEKKALVARVRLLETALEEANKLLSQHTTLKKNIQTQEFTSASGLHAPPQMTLIPTPLSPISSTQVDETSGTKRPRTSTMVVKEHSCAICQGSGGLLGLMHTECGAMAHGTCRRSYKGTICPICSQSL